MFIESKLRTRLIASMDWMIADLKHRADECLGNLDFGLSGGYSPQLTEAIQLLDLLKGTMPAPTEQQCRDMAAMLGKPDSWGSGYFRTYASQGWCKGNGVPITDVRLHMQELKNRGVEYPDAPTEAPTQDAQGMTPRQRHIAETGR